MAKRFTATEIWEEDWFLEMPNEYKLFWYYMLSNCDHAGVYKVNLRSFSGLLEVKVTSSQALSLFNSGKQRIRQISDSVWFIEDFFVYQYGDTLNRNNRVHQSIEKIYCKHHIDLASIRGLKEVKDRVKDKDKDKDNTTGVKYMPEKLAPQMVKRFKEAYPFYPVSEEDDFTACLQIAYKIAKEKGWSKESVLNGRMNEVLDVWGKIIDFSTTDKWYSTRSLSDFSREFQRIVQGMVQSKKKILKKENGEESTAPPLSYIKQ